MQNRKVCMHSIFNFYAFTVNITIGIYTVDLFTWGLGFCNVMMKCSHETFYLSFLNVMLMQKSKYAKVKNNSCNAKK